MLRILDTSVWKGITLSSNKECLCITLTVEHNYISPSSTVGIELHVSAPCGPASGCNVTYRAAIQDVWGVLLGYWGLDGGNERIKLHFQSLAVTVCTTRTNITKFYILPTEYLYTVCTCHRKNNEVFPIQPSTTGFHNRGGECLLRGTTWALK